jgi:NAD(P)-dependent dehydrogenase (short-subunit alcohol dehydrogenase family)
MTGQVTGMPERTVLVVGGTSGIGAAIATRFAGEGATVTAAGLRPEAAPAVLADRAEVVDLDVRDGEALERLVDGVTSRSRGLDVLVNAAGIIRRSEEFDPQVFRDVLEINLTAAMRACVAAHPALVRRQGCVVNVASVLTFRGGPLVPAYTASKGGMAALTRSLAVAWGAAGVRVNAIAPGWIRTDLTAALQDDDQRSADIVSRTPLGRWGQTDDVSGAATFLAGPDAAFITGVTLPVDGGYLAT